ncbi:ATP-binding cassette domain-containing protein [Robertkochia marina]|uniref:ATP-binding cassette domain-containing protein n=1 Tax=Robertkochia marina TaxID=1227945 RepID=A0A4S3LYU6_9FLAO|nr:ATP-binding cassette domain-containing protein [Robertkochia marina]THD66321.1 ATP-binding cassette domain-containing protein [Robertkochia marina]TRZ41241.1 ATP-binding cassette domain-containing protein [Robertkochia marina]
MAEYKKTITSWQRFLSMLSLDKKDIYQIAYYAIFAGLVSLTLPLGIQAIINLLQAAQTTTSWVVLVVLVTLGVAFTGVLQLMQLRIIENIQQKIFTRSAFEFSYRFPKIKMSELEDYYPPELANRFFDTLTIQKTLSKLLIDVPAAFLQILFGLILLSFYHPFFIVYGLMLIVLIYVVFKFTYQRGLSTSLEESKYKYKIAHWIQEVARSIVSFKLSGRTNLAMSKSDYLTNEYLDAREGHFRILILQFIQMIGFKVLVTAGLLVVGGLLVLNQQMNIGQFVAAEIIILLVINSVEKLILSLEPFYDMLTSLEKLGQAVDKNLELQEGELDIADDEGLHISLEDVGYHRPSADREIIKNINLEIEPKELIAVQGVSSSGKSTLLKLIAGLIEPTRGNMYINNANSKIIRPNAYRSLLGQSLIEESPFEGTILENLTFGDTSIPKKDIEWAIDLIGLREFVKAQPKGLNTELKPEGMQISSTISKKIVLARSIIRKPKLLILSDPLDKFEPKEKEHIINALTGPDRPWGIVVESREPLWTRTCGRVLTMQNGEIINIKDNNNA